MVIQALKIHDTEKKKQIKLFVIQINLMPETIKSFYLLDCDIQKVTWEIFNLRDRKERRRVKRTIFHLTPLSF